MTLPPMHETVILLVGLVAVLTTASIVAGIYLQALKLWWKRIPFHTRPSKVPAHVDDIAPQS